jgi:hypothetical protein
MKNSSADATIKARQVYRSGAISPFVLDEHNEYWSVCAGLGLKVSPVQRFSKDGWAAGIFHRDDGFIRMVKAGEVCITPGRQTMIACAYRKGVRWEYQSVPPST